MVSSEFRSRSERLRTVVREMLARRYEAETDAKLTTGYGMQPPAREDKAWAELSVEGLQAADLDW